MADSERRQRDDQPAATRLPRVEPFAARRSTASTVAVAPSLQPRRRPGAITPCPNTMSKQCPRARAWRCALVLLVFCSGATILVGQRQWQLALLPALVLALGLRVLVADGPGSSGVLDIGKESWQPVVEHLAPDAAE
jgi:hypothetical protein